MAAAGPAGVAAPAPAPTPAHRLSCRPSFQAAVKSSELTRATVTLPTPLSSRLRLAAETPDLLTSVATTCQKRGRGVGVGVHRPRLSV